MSLTVTDLFCGAGGSALGATAVPGMELRMATNHWALAVETHAANFPHADHDTADISQVNPRRYAYTDILWASPECTNHSQAKGRKRAAAQPDLFGDALPDEAAVRSRATMWDVPRFAEHHAYRAVIVENVVDAAKWVLWDAWLHAMTSLGYLHRVVYLNSMHAPAMAAPRAPQSRDRLYVVFWRKGNRVPDLDVHPLAWCQACAVVVASVQWWKRPEHRWGRYRSQYLYRCPTPRCSAVVEPYALPAASAIDWTMPGQRIGDRAKPLSAKTIERIRAGLDRYTRPMVVPLRTHGVALPDSEPFKTFVAGNVGQALVVPVEGRDNVNARLASNPLRTQTARLQDALVLPYYGSTRYAQPADWPMPTMATRDTAGIAFIAELRGGGSTARDVSEPLATVTAAGNHHMLVRHNTARGDPAQMCTPATEPARTLTTKGHQSIVGWPGPAPEVDDCTFRMLEPHEIQAAMAFRTDYGVLGNRHERVPPLPGLRGVTPPAAEHLIRAVSDALIGGV